MIIISGFQTEREFLAEQELKGKIVGLCKELIKIKKLSDESGVKLDYYRAYRATEELWDSTLHYFDRGMKGTTWAAVNGDQYYLVYLMLLLAEIGVIEAEEDFYSDVLLGLSEETDELFKLYVIPKVQAYNLIMDNMREALKRARKERETQVAENGDC